MCIELNQAGIDQALPRVASGLRKYSWLQGELHSRDVSEDRQYQTRFNGFYRVRRSTAWQRVFYAILERTKSRPASLGDVLLELHSATGRVEASFASKLVATTDPWKPVIDGIVLGHLRLKLRPSGTMPQRIERILAVHNQLARSFADYLRTEDGCYLVTRFSESYPGANLTTVKMLDLVLWQTRAAA